MLKETLADAPSQVAMGMEKNAMGAAPLHIANSKTHGHSPKGFLLRRRDRLLLLSLFSSQTVLRAKTPFK